MAATYAGFGAALIGDRTGSERAFDRARRHLHDADHDASWGFFLDEPYIAAHEAHGKLALGSYRIAAEQFSDAISAMRPEYLRDQAVYLSRQAVAYARTGQFEPAAHVGLTALRVGVSTGSERVLHNVRQRARTSFSRWRRAWTATSTTPDRNDCCCRTTPTSIASTRCAPNRMPFSSVPPPFAPTTRA
ncbi:Uncharacterised protein [Mycobacteroides abscessus subsp. abscessus]|nr:Uncharacterised protein [Mycobacteroides abscessus subsp. abscessus]